MELFQPPEVSEPSQPEDRKVAVITTTADPSDSPVYVLEYLSHPIPKISGMLHVRLPSKLHPCAVSASPLASLWTPLPQQRAGEGEIEL